MDLVHEQTDKKLETLEKKITREYNKAYKTIKKKTDGYFKSFEAEDKAMLKKLNANEITLHEYTQWRENKMLTGDKWKALRDSLATDLVNTDKIAAGMINDSLPDVYALNFNYGTYEIENGYQIDTNFALYDRATVQRLMSDDPRMIPRPRVDIPKDMRWNRNKITSAMTQAVLSGDSIPHIAERLRSVTTMDKNASIRNARTYTTSAENAGRTDSYKRANDLGIEIEQQWVAMWDGRTRSSHRHLDGERIKVGEKFSNGLRYPADPEGAPEEIYNCRCRIIGALVDFERQKIDITHSKMGNMTYDEWEKAKDKKQKDAGAPVSVGITATLFSSVGRDIVEKQLNDAPPVIRNLWAKFQDEFNAPVSDNSGYFSDYQLGGLVHYNPIKVVEGNYQTHYHEYGHYMDWLAGGANASGANKYFFSHAWRDKDGRGFEDIIIDEWKNKFLANKPTPLQVLLDTFSMNIDVNSGGTGAKNFISSEIRSWRRGNMLGFDDPKYKSLMSQLNGLADDDIDGMVKFIKKNIDIFDLSYYTVDESKVIQKNLQDYIALMKQDYSIGARRDLSDMLERFSLHYGCGEYPLGAGHGFSYAIGDGSLAVEAFAEMYSAYTSNPMSLELIKNELPESHAAFLRMLEDMTK